MRPLQKDPKDFSLGYIQFILARCFPFFLCFSIKLLGLQTIVGQRGQFVKGSLCPIDRLFSFNVFPVSPYILSGVCECMCACIYTS
jgi:hypothetical protein